MHCAPIALDACVLINLCATDHVEAIARTLDIQFVVAREVSGEALYLRPADLTTQELVPIRLEPLIADRVLEVTDLRSDELATFVAAAALLDDGEAATLALAVHRHPNLATDDRAALRLIAAEYRELQVHSTSQLLRRYCEAASVSPEHAAACLTAIEQRASFIPGAADPELTWWQATTKRTR